MGEKSDCQTFVSYFRKRTTPESYLAAWAPKNPSNVFEGGLLVYFDPQIDNTVGLVLNRVAVIVLMENSYF